MHRNSCDVEEQARKWQSTWLSCVVSGLTNTDRYQTTAIPALFVLDVFVVAANVINLGACEWWWAWTVIFQ